MWNCIRQERTRISSREEELKNLIHGIEQKQPEKPVIKIENKILEEKTQYI